MTPALQQQHERWAAAHARLRGHAPVRPRRAVFIPPAAPAEWEVPHPTLGLPVLLVRLPSWRVLVQLAALKHGVKVADILSPDKTDRIADARHEAIWLCRTHLPKTTLSMIGRLFGRDHSSVLNSVRVHKRNMAGEKRLTRLSNAERRQQKSAPVHNSGPLLERTFLPLFIEDHHSNSEVVK